MVELLKSITEFVSKHERNYVYGAGSFGTALCEWLVFNGVKIDGYAVSQIDEQIMPGECYQTPVFQIDTLDYPVDQSGFILGVHDRFHDQIIAKLQGLGCGGIYTIENSILIQLRNDSLKLTDDILKEFSYTPECVCDSIEKLRRILLVRLDGIGDAVLFSAFIRELKKNYKDSRIDLVIAPYLMDVYRHCPYIDSLIVFDWKRIYKATIRGRFKCIERFCKEKLRMRNYDVCIVPRWDTDEYSASIISFLSGANTRIGYSESVNKCKADLNGGYDKMYTQVLYKDDVMHEVERNLFILDVLGLKDTDNKLEVWPDPVSINSIKKKLCDEELNKNAYVALGIYAGSKKRIWDYRNYIELVKRMSDADSGIRFILLGGTDAVQTAGLIEEACSNRVLNLAGKLSLEESIAVFQFTEAYIGNDTGLMHIAAATGNSVYEISCFPRDGDDSSSNSVKRFRPWQAKGIVFQPERCLDGCEGECKKDYAHCINQITCEEVFKSIMNHWKREVCI